MIDRRSPLLGSAIVLVAGSLFALLAVFSSWAYDDGLTAFAFVVWRSGVAALFMAAVVVVGLRRGRRLVGWRSLSPRDRVALFVAALMGASLDVTMFLAYERVSVAVVLLCFYLFPAMVAVASAALGWEPLDRVRSMALVIALGGMVAVVVGGQGVGGSTGIDPVGVLLALGSAASQAVFVLVARRGYREVPSDQAISFVLFVSTVIAATLAIVTGGAGSIGLPFAMPDLLVLLVFAGIVAAAIPSFLFLAGIRWIGGVRAGILMLVQAPVGVALAALFLDEGITAIQVAGGVAILVAAAIIQRGAAGSPDAAAEPAAASAPIGG
jgi:drug/metabolite transporter (DMT)-like permease